MIRRGVADGDLLRIGCGRPSRLSRELAVSRGLPVYRRRDEYTG